MKSKLYRAGAVAVGAVMIALVCYFFSAIVGYIITALILTLVAQPPIQWLDNRQIKNFRLPHGWNVFIVVLLLFLLFFAMIFAFAPLFISQANMVSQIHFEDFSDKFRNSYSHFHQYLKDNHLEDFLVTAERSAMEKCNILSL